MNDIRKYNREGTEQLNQAHIDMGVNIFFANIADVSTDKLESIYERIHVELRERDERK